VGKHGLSFFLVAALSGCSYFEDLSQSEDQNPEDTSSVDTGEVDEVDITDNTLFGTMNVEVTFKNQPLNCTVNAVNSDNEVLHWMCGEDSPDIPVGDYLVTIGSGDYNGVSGYEMDDGSVVVITKRLLTVSSLRPTSVSYPANLWFGGTFNCHMSSWNYDAGAIGYKGSLRIDDEDQGDTSLYVQDGIQIINEEDSSFYGVIFGSEWFGMDGDAFDIRDVSGQQEHHLQLAIAESEGILFQMVYTNIMVEEVTCNKISD